MGGTKTRKKTLKIIFMAAILLTATTAAVTTIQNQNQNTTPLINTYIQYISQGPQTVVQEKAINISSNYTFTGNIYETINVLADNIVIDGNGYTLQGSGSRYGFNLENRSNVTIKNVVVTGWYLGVCLVNGFYNNLSGNTINGNTLGVYLSNSSHNNFTGNTADNIFWGFYLWNSSYNTFSGNTANHNGYWGNGFLLEQSSYNTFSGNTANNNGYDGFNLDSSSYNNLTGNTAKNNRNLGFRLYNSSYNNLTGNTESNSIGYSPDWYCYGYGFGLFKSSNNALTGNTAKNNDGYGFYLYDNSDNNNLSGNTAKNNGDYGFYLVNSAYNTITGNTVVDFWGHGFDLDPYSHDNIIENNTVISLGLTLLFTPIYHSEQQSKQSGSNALIVGLLVTLVTVSLVWSVLIYRRRAGVVTDKGKPSPRPERWKPPS